MNPSLRFFSFFLLTLSTFSTVLAQLPPLQPEQDCTGALPICSAITIINDSYQGEGINPNEIDPLPSCLNSGEQNNVWFRFQPASSGMVCFSLIPVNITNDYDWAVYDLTAHECADIYGDSTLEISCNYSGTPGVTGPNGLSGGANNPCIPVQGGEDFVIMVSNFSATGTGFTLDFTATNTNFFDSTIVQIDTVSNLPNLNGLLLEMSDPVLCAQINNGDIVVSDTSGFSYPILSTTGIACVNNFSSLISVVLDTLLSPNQLLNLQAAITENFVHQCLPDSLDNWDIPVPVNKIIPTVSIASPEDLTNVCQGDSLLLTSNFAGFADFQTTWMPGNLQTDQIWVAGEAGVVYSASVTFLSTGMTGQASISPTVIPDPRPYLQPLPDTLVCQEDLFISLPDSFATYQWSTGDNTPGIWVSSTDAGLITVEVGTQAGCLAQDSMILRHDELPEGSISFELDSVLIATLHLNSNAANADSIWWDMGNGTVISGSAISYTYTSSGTYTIVLWLASECGLATDSLYASFAVTAGISGIRPEAVRIWQIPGMNTLAANLDLPMIPSGYQVELLNLAGQTIWKQQQILPGNARWEIPSIPAGLYFIRLKGQSGTLILTRKIRFL